MRSAILFCIALAGAFDVAWAQQNKEPLSLTEATLSYDEESLSQPSEIDGTDDSAQSSESGSDAELAKKLQNPVAAMISVPFQSNFDFGGGVDARAPRHFSLRRFGRRRSPGVLHQFGGGVDNDRREPLALRLLPDFRGPRGIVRSLTRGPLGHDREDRDEAFRYTMNFQPVVPISLNDEWNVISRTILPIVCQDEVLGTSHQFGLGDLTQSLFFSPKKAEPFIWGVGPVIYLPTATDDTLGSERWGMGPTGVALKQDGPWTFGILANHIWSFARDDGRKEINSTFLQPFLSYTFPNSVTLNTNTESTYDWIDHQWTVPVQAGVGKVFKFGKLPVNLALNGRYWVEGPDSAPDWGVRFVVTFLLPEK